MSFEHVIYGDMLNDDMLGIIEGGNIKLTLWDIESNLIVIHQTFD